MKIVFFSDIHGNKYVLEPLLQAIKEEGADQVIFCGDIFGYYYYQNEIIDMFRKEGYLTLLGNHDQYFLDIIDQRGNRRDLIQKYGNSYNDISSKISPENIEYLRGLKPFHVFEADNIRIGVFHGSPADHLNGRIYPDTTIEDAELYSEYDFVILGHTHHKMVRMIGTTTVINPGSIGQQRDGKGCSYLILDTHNSGFSFANVEYDVESLIKDIEKYDANNAKLVEVLLRKA
jgi:putative phosphoesterase